MGIVAEDVARVREATDIVQLISSTVALRKAGRRWQGLCPFHTENTPSFSVNAEEGLYYCFGCRASGDAITFVRETEGLDFVASVEVLAARAGITLRYDNKGEAAQSGRRKQLIGAAAAAVEWYHERLLSHPDAGAARGYLRSRGMSGEEVRAFKLGWAPDAWSALSRALREQASLEVLTDAGLAYRNKRGSLTDTFRSRLLFPVFDVRGDPVGFGGRVLPGADGPAGPKYKNTPESALYVKSRLLYGLNWAKDAIVRSGEVVVCEGYTDVIGLHAAGLPQAVATCGTALTEHHVRTLSRFTKRVVLAFDADAAGSAAAERIYQWESAYSLDVYVADLPPGSDPDDLARRCPEDLRGLVAAARPFLAYRIDRALARGNMATAEGRVRAADAALAVVDEHPSEIVRDQYLMDVADRCHLPSDRLRDAVGQFRATRAGARSRGREPAGQQPRAVQAEPGIEEQILLLRMHAPGELPDWMAPELFSSEFHARLFTLLGDGASPRRLAESATGAAADVLARLSVREPPTPAAPVIGRFVFDSAGRWISDMTRAARRTGDAALGRRLGEVQLTCSELQATNWSPEIAESLARLLGDVGAGTATGPVGGEPQVSGGAAEEERFFDDVTEPEGGGMFEADQTAAGESRP